MIANVMGLDISLTKTGIALPSGETVLSRSAISKKTGDRRLAKMYDEVYALLTETEVTHVVMEDLPINGQGAGGTGQAQGVVRLALQQLDIPFVKVVASTLKKYATGSGRASKDDMHAALPLAQQARIPKTSTGWDDRTDAWWLWHMGMTKLGQPHFSHAVREAPSVVKWEGWGL